MHRASLESVGSSNAGPLRRNQACHQCRARKLKCDAGRPCSTCKRSHAKAVASLTSAGQSVLAEPSCTYDYAPGEDPWTATLRHGMGLTPSRPPSKSGSISPGNLSSDNQTEQSSNYLSPPAPLPSNSPHQIGPHRSRHSSSSRNRSPSYPSSNPIVLSPHGSVRSMSPLPAGLVPAPGARDAFSSPLPPLGHFGGSPPYPNPNTLHSMPPYVLPHSSNDPSHDLDYQEMVDMLYNPSGPFFDSQPPFLQLPPYVNPYFSGVPASGGVSVYASDPLGDELYNSSLDLMSNLEVGEAPPRRGATGRSSGTSPSARGASGRR
ncbi:hypothetical protein BDV93DRAFT_553447 [Ceratobasidium sp. AG-I]|nr:hypothetical protein BDV93DRAFT_553447 [Ceratobasidium sp. AG-I]